MTIGLKPSAKVPGAYQLGYQVEDQGVLVWCKLRESVSGGILR